MKLLIASISLALSVMTTAEEAKSNRYNTANGSQALFYPDGIAFVTISQSYNP